MAPRSPDNKQIILWLTTAHNRDGTPFLHWSSFAMPWKTYKSLSSVWASQAIRSRWNKRVQCIVSKSPEAPYAEPSPNVVTHLLIPKKKKNMNDVLSIQCSTMRWQSWESCHSGVRMGEPKRVCGHWEYSTYLWDNARSLASCPPGVWHCRRSWWSAPRDIYHHWRGFSPPW